MARLLFHLQHVAPFPAVDQIGMVVSLGGTVLLATGLLWPDPHRRAVTSSPDAPSSDRRGRRDPHD
ncbi:hypothetical protein [Nakamurella leprariae]|uniref:Uncharacterized protein n=1 Tax=Nakamurella leprariae TaxID=2803911 RepID=A0A939C1E7_9ACTN|nr:hypothetical protein [Nakamurella leprariae]MBM9467079.1 hypothetical protein [Nakamurella leprariae]